MELDERAVLRLAYRNLQIAVELFEEVKENNPTHTITELYNKLFESYKMVTTYLVTT